MNSIYFPQPASQDRPAATPTRDYELLYPVQSSLAFGAEKENAAPPSLNVPKSPPGSPPRLVTCPNCTAYTSCLRNSSEFSCCAECGQAFCSVCNQCAWDHATPAPCPPRHRQLAQSLREITNARPVMRRPEASVFVRTTLPAVQSVTGTTSEAAYVPEPQMGSPQKRKKPSSAKQEATRRLRRL